MSSESTASSSYLNVISTKERKEANQSKPWKKVHLDELLNDCFLYSIDCLIDEEKRRTVLKFVNFLEEVHSSENVQFVVEAFKYEYFYYKVMEIENNTDSYSKEERRSPQEFLNPLLADSLDKLPYPNIKQIAFSLANLKGSSGSLCLEIEDSIFPVGIGELDLSSPLPLHSDRMAWDNFRDISLLEDDCSNDNVDAYEESIIYDREGSPLADDQYVISKQWTHILSTFIQAASEKQVNLTDETYRMLMDENMNNTTFHDPIKLRAAKNEVFHLLEENAYCSFLNSYKLKCHRAQSPRSQTSQSSPESLGIGSRRNSASFPKTFASPISPVLTSSGSLLNRHLSYKKKFFSNVSNLAYSNSEPHSMSSSASNISHLFDNLKLHFPNKTDTPRDSEVLSPELLSPNQQFSKEDKVFKFKKFWKPKRSN